MWISERHEPLYPELQGWCETNRIHPLVRPLITKYGINDIDDLRKFLSSDLSCTTSSLAFGPEIYKAVKRINEAVKNGEHIVLFGDYDVDGTTGTALLLAVFSHFQKQKDFTVDFMVPNRFTEGYGLNDKSIRRLIEMKPDLVITIDCGITSAKQIQELKQLGIDTIVTDHHNPKGPLPDMAAAIVHPQVCNYPDHKICGCAVAYQLAKALWETKNFPVPHWVEYGLIDLVALGTICDMMPIRGDNRVYVKAGLDRMNRHPRPAIAMMKRKFRWSKIDRNTVGFQIGPCINANGRIEKADLSVRFFLAQDPKECKEIVDIMYRRNEERKRHQSHVVEEGLKQIDGQPYRNLIVIHGEEFHEGVVGIAAGKIVNKFRKPTFILHGSGDILGGSARSLAGINLFQSMKKFEGHLHSWGGHAAAAGLRIKRSEMDTFFRLLDEDLNRYGEEVWNVRPVYFGEISSSEDLTDDFFRSLEMFEPFGYDFPAPIWKIVGRLIDERQVRKDSKVGKIEMFGKEYNFAMWENSDKARLFHTQTFYGTWSQNPTYGIQFMAEDADPPKRATLSLKLA